MEMRARIRRFDIKFGESAIFNLRLSFPGMNVPHKVPCLALFAIG